MYVDSLIAYFMVVTYISRAHISYRYIIKCETRDGERNWTGGWISGTRDCRLVSKTQLQILGGSL